MHRDHVSGSAPLKFDVALTASGIRLWVPAEAARSLARAFSTNDVRACDVKRRRPLDRVALPVDAFMANDQALAKAAVRYCLAPG
jgi:hypothetical protein